MKSDHYCGCCGREVHSSCEWCADCLNHVAHGGLPPWRRTYEAQHGVLCPYQPHAQFQPIGAA